MKHCVNDHAVNVLKANIIIHLSLIWFITSRKQINGSNWIISDLFEIHLDLIGPTFGSFQIHLDLSISQFFSWFISKIRADLVRFFLDPMDLIFYFYIINLILLEDCKVGSTAFTHRDTTYPLIKTSFSVNLMTQSRIQALHVCFKCRFPPSLPQTRETK